MTDKSDRKRLEAEVHTTDLKESQLNEDFIDNLKQYGPWVLVAVLTVIAARLWMARTAQDAIIRRDTAWVRVADNHRARFAGGCRARLDGS